MKAKALQLGKAMSAALFVLLLVVVGMKNALAQTQVATLQHGDDVSAYYGVNAFVEAHIAAQAGDIITLSSGTFTPCDITKAITLRGAGCAVDTVANINPTMFGANITLNVADTVNSLTIEGILFTGQVGMRVLYSPKFNRCNFTDIVQSTYTMENAQFINCIIDKLSIDRRSNIVLINSLAWQLTSREGRVVLYNSILSYMPAYGYALQNLVAYNSIYINRSIIPASSCSFINCIGINLNNGSNNSSFGQGFTLGCVEYLSYEEVFESFAGTFSFDEAFLLKNEIAMGFHGGDGTQVGIYGGPIPYSSRPGYMVLKRCNVAGRSTIDGKLSVDIEVVTEE